ncbi:CinA family protein [Leifsonella bigeumensis]|uniref:CinA family protein n=1 Tax=Leifsonella bigeumensis TaxID=433643 RepID=UPI0031D07C98
MPAPDVPAHDVARLIAGLASRGLTLAVAESLTGGLLVAELIRPAGASAVVLGGVVAYDTELKHTLLGVDSALLAEHGPVHPDVARQLARNVRDRLAVAGRPADIGIATTGVAGPDPQGGQQPGTVFLGLSMGEETRSRRLELTGSRDEIRIRTVEEAIRWIGEALERGLVSTGE